MSYPENLVMVRHGESEVNFLRKMLDGIIISDEQEAKILSRPDWQQRLSIRGIAQSCLARNAIEELYGGVDYFDKLYTSPYIRTRETAAIISLNSEVLWNINNLLSERSWGSDANLTNQNLYLKSKDSPKEPSWMKRFNNGESFLDVIYRSEMFLDSLRNRSDDNVLAIGHEGIMSAIRYILENMTPERWLQIERIGRLAIRNGTLLQYTRRNPDEFSDLRITYGWRRMIYTDKDRSSSPDYGDWIDITMREQYSPLDLSLQVQEFSQIIDNNE